MFIKILLKLFLRRWKAIRLITKKFLLKLLRLQKKKVYKNRFKEVSKGKILGAFFVELLRTIFMW
ncbi:protein of unknown function [Petrocella atlantisensis]|uniref:Uncharacterized protein n=1 Tax=Petrocella atlantisensis TaxID=2173034 RepID=A0A3P7NRV3_9FIRM|nr:protein of unknown function [Petrocella atlantisensis]